MGLKTSIRRLCKFLPKSPELATALAMDDQAGRQNLNLDDVINGSYTPVDEETGEVLERKAGNGETDSKHPLKVVPSKLDNVITALRDESSVEALDEVFIRAETVLDDGDLEIATREYRKCKESLTNNEGLF
jgi:recombination protein RecT